MMNKKILVALLTSALTLSSIVTSKIRKKRLRKLNYWWIKDLASKKIEVDDKIYEFKHVKVLDQWDHSYTGNTGKIKVLLEVVDKFFIYEVLWDTAFIADKVYLDTNKSPIISSEIIEISEQEADKLDDYYSLGI